MRSIKRACLKCRTIFTSRTHNKFHCGNRINKSGCTWEIRKEYNKAYIRKFKKPLRLRFEILKKYKFTCQYCGRKAPEVPLQIDHLFPKSKGGINRRSNFIVACIDCNIGKGDVLLD